MMIIGQSYQLNMETEKRRMHASSFKYDFLFLDIGLEMQPRVWEELRKKRKVVVLSYLCTRSEYNEKYV